ncbi:MAG: N-acetylmuramoyl-L-alanine amidase [Armatimonadetes bacterium]|nr:N-acetylmuramoyl-L-alanine amidase [Armatimonadota bacterium]
MKHGSKWPLLLICLCLLLPAASARSAAVMYLDETGYPTFYERADAYDPVSALSLLASPPSEAEAGKKLTSAVLPGTKLIGMHQDGGTTVVNFSKEVVGAGLDEVRLEAVYEQVRGTLWQFGIPGEVRVLAEGTALSQFVPAPAPVQPSAQALADGKDRVVTTSGLSGRKITVSPGHGKRWNGSSWATARPVYCSPLNQEDYHNLELCQYLETYLAQDGTTVKMVRCTNKSYGASPWAGGDDWWHMGASYWLQHVGYPCSVYGPAGCNLGEGGSDDTNEIQSRPLSSDYDNSDIYISMHTNGSAGDCFGTGCPTGTCTYYDAGTEHAAWGAVSQSLATNVNNSMIDAIRTKYPDAGWSNRGVLNSDGGFGEIRIPDRAAILIELAFHDSCDTDAVKLRDNFFRSTTMWAVYKGVCDYFGTTPTWAYYSNELVSHDIPANMTVGERYTVHVTMRNRGVLWNDAKGFHLGAVDDSDPCTTTTRQPISGEVGPNSTYTFTFVLRAPLSTGTYTTDWRMVRDGFQWFGPVASQTINVTGTPDTQAPTVPTGLSAAAQDEMHVNLTWNASTDDRGVIGYYIYRNNVKIGTSATTSYSDGGCVPSTTYTYEVSAYDDFFNESGRSDPAQATTPVPSPPTVPQNLRGTGSTTSSISLAWDASTDNIGVVGYRVYRNGAQVGTTAGTTYTDTGLNYTTSYTYQVDAYDGVPSYSAKSASVVLSTQTPSYYTWTRSTSNADCYIRSGAPDAAGDNTAVQTGWSSTTTIAARRGLVRWDMTGAPAQAAVVNAAGSVRVKLYCYLRSSNTARNIDLRKVTADWNEGSATWNNMAANYSTTFATCSVGAVGDYTWSWNGYTGGLPEQNRGVQVYNQAETENLMAKIFNDMENYGAVGIYPRLEIDYYDIVAPTNCTISINAGAAYATSRSVTLNLSASDFPSGMSQMQFSADGVNYSTPEAYATTKSYTLPAGDGLKTVYVKYKDVSGNWSAAVSDTITLDTSPPTGELTINDGDTYAFSSSVTLAVSFTDAVEMRFNNENGAWSAWQAYAPTKSWSLSAGEGAKTVYAQLRDAAGNVSTDTISDGITVVGAGGTISQAKALSDGQAVVLLGKTVVANFGGTIYVEEADGSSGIRVEASGPAVGNSADVAGVIQTNANGERYVAGATVSAGGAAAMPFVPLLRTSALGGGALNAYTIGVTGGISVNNIGLLVSVAGKITRDDAGFAYVDDGSLVQDGSGWIGVRVDKTGLTAAFTEGKQCVITGVSSILKQGEAYIPVLRPRNDADAVIYP